MIGPVLCVSIGGVLHGPPPACMVTHISLHVWLALQPPESQAIEDLQREKHLVNGVSVNVVTVTSVTMCFWQQIFKLKYMS